MPATGRVQPAPALENRRWCLPGNQSRAADVPAALNCRHGKTALILFAHGARDPEWANPMRRVRAAVMQQAPAMRVELAFLEFMSPNLAIARSLVAEGYTAISIVPMFIAQGHLQERCAAVDG